MTAHPLLPADWPQPGPIDLGAHDLPHASATTEWWYVNGHLTTDRGRRLSVFASFFRIVRGLDPVTRAPQYAHSVTWAIIDPQTASYVGESRVDPDAPVMGLQRLERGEGWTDRRVQRALREVLERGQIPRPDRLMRRPVFCATQRLELDFDGNTLRKRDDGRYELNCRHEQQPLGFRLTFELQAPPCRHGDDGLVRGAGGEDMFYVFVPRCRLEGSVLLPGGEERVVSGSAWYDHEFGKHLGDAPAAGDRSALTAEIGWNWCGVQLDDGHSVTAYALFDEKTGASRGQWAVLVRPDGSQVSARSLELTPDEQPWVSTRTFQSYPTRWRLRLPELGLDLGLQAAFPDQEFITLISKPAFWEGRVDVSGTLEGRPVAGLGFVERSGQSAIHNLDDFFGAVGREVRKSVAAILPREPTWTQARDMVAGPERAHVMAGVDIDQLARSMVDPVRDVVDRGGKSWRSYAALACCDVVGGDSREFVQWLAMPELMHTGSLIVDDVQDRSHVRRGGPSAHLVYGDALAINAGTACYFMGQRLLYSERVSATDRLRLYDFYFESLRAGHAGQALDLAGHDRFMPTAVEAGDADGVEARVLAVHRLKTAVPAASLARMGALVGGGSEAQIEGVGHFFEALGLAFQIVDDILNLRGFRGDLKSRGEDIAHGKVTRPVAKALARLPLERRRALWALLQRKTTEQAEIDAAIEELEACGAIAACETDARQMVEDAWARLEPLVEASLPKLMLRSFGWYVLERHY
jgi:geranylgeranyl pyrophosphate synthase/predicted secreted hydrolase